MTSACFSTCALSASCSNSSRLHKDESSSYSAPVVMLIEFLGTTSAITLSSTSCSLYWTETVAVTLGEADSYKLEKENNLKHK